MIKNNYETPECLVFDAALNVALCVSDWPGTNESMEEIEFEME